MDAEAGEEVRVEGDPYAEHTLTWSPDSGSLVAYRVVPGYERMVHYAESAPEDRLQPRHSTITYTKPGDALDVRRPVLFHLDDGEQIVVDNRLFPNAYSISSPEWREAGWIPPEVFTATGRDGETEIWGIIVRPSNFDPARDYPVVESIYAGPHDNHVPKSFSVFPPRGMREQAELGFFTVMIDGMGISNRSKAFHDVAWKNLGDAGFPDRILWHEAVAERYDYYDLDRVGIYGGSAGGQNAMGGLLFHPSSTTWVWPTTGATTTESTRSGGTSCG